MARKKLKKKQKPDKSKVNEITKENCKSKNLEIKKENSKPYSLKIKKENSKSKNLVIKKENSKSNSLQIKKENNKTKNLEIKKENSKSFLLPKKIETTKKSKKLKKLSKISKSRKQKIKLKKSVKKTEKPSNILNISNGEFINPNTKDNPQLEKKSSIKNLKTNKPSQTLLQLINNKEDLTDIQLNDNINGAEPTKKKTVKKNKNITPNTNSTIKKFEDRNQYIKSIKPRVVIINGKITIEKPDVGLINKQYNEELNKNLIPLESSNNSEKKITSLSYIKTNHSNKWTEEETKLFYKALEMFGLDFSFIEIVLKPRTRGEIKRKYLKEKKTNQKLIDKAIYSRKNLGKINEVLKVYKSENNDDLLNVGNEKNEINNNVNENKEAGDAKNKFEDIYKKILIK